MPSSKPEWEVRVHGQQLANVDVDLMAQIVVILGREMMTNANKTEEGENDEPDNP